jgi:NAD(P)-dependent dehydrogenase (short-subunit alcohol dehydrogenase family)
MVRVLAREWASKNVLINAIGPAMTETQVTSTYLSDQNSRAKAIASIPMGRLGEPEDIIATILLLLSAGGRFITGQTIYVDGGRTLV